MLHTSFHTTAPQLEGVGRGVRGGRSVSALLVSRRYANGERGVAGLM